MQRKYRILDVFTERALAGNALAVVLDGEGLDDGAMQALAREFNLSETVFVLPPEKPAHWARLRIFTPGAELPFAGHPTVGTAVCLALERVGRDGDLDALLVLEEGIGPVRCGVKLRSGAGFAQFDCPRLPERVGAAEPKEFIAAALDIAPSEIGFENHLPSVWTAGVPYHFVPVRNMSVLARTTPIRSAWARAFRQSGALVYTRETEGFGHSFRARMFWPSTGIDEDPATGAAAAAFAGPVQDFDDMPDGEHTAIIEQGYEMGRPSLIRLEMAVSAGALAAVRIGGHAVVVMSGTLSV